MASIELAGGVVVELHVEEVDDVQELGDGDGLVGLRALRCGGEIVRFGGVGGHEGAQCGHQRGHVRGVGGCFVVCIVPVMLAPFDMSTRGR